MGWGQNPADVAAAERAAVEARERIDNRPLTPGERQIVNVLERIAEGIDALKPEPLEPLIEGVVRDSLTRSLDTLGNLLGADPRDLSVSIDAGATALGNTLDLRLLYDRKDLELLAEVVIDAALKQAADMAANGGQAVAADEEVAAGDQAPAATSSTT